jgi:hypothetical protein
MLNVRPYTGRATRETRTLIVALMLGVLVLGLLVAATIVATSPSLLARGQNLLTGSFAPAHQADYTSAGDRPVAPQRPAR